MSINKKIRYSTIVLLGLSSTAALADWNFRPKVHLGIMDYEASVRDLGDGQAVRRIVGFDWSTNDGSDISVTPIIYGIGATISKDKYYLDAYIQSSSSEDSGPGMASGRGNIINPQAVDFERDDFSIAFGRKFGKNWTIGIGYRNGETSYSQNFDIRANGTTRLENLPAIREAELELDGPFISIGKAFPFDNGTLGFNLGVADLDGDWRISQTIVETGFNSGGVNLQDSAVGANVGVSWNGLITERLGYSLGADYYDYSFRFRGVAQVRNQDGEITFSGDGTPNDLRDARVRAEESALTFKLTIGYQF